MPALVTAIGLIFAVLTERVRWSVAFKTVVFMPMAISLFAAGVIWRVMYAQDPDVGAVNASIGGVKDAFDADRRPRPKRGPSTDDITGIAQAGFVLDEPLSPGGDSALLGPHRHPA